MSNLSNNELNHELRDIKRFLREDTRTIIKNEIKSTAADKKSKSNAADIIQQRNNIANIISENASNKKLIENVLDREARIINILFEILK
jgi:pyoverdine/dityrosine biosynthesis protein Dit1